MAKKGKMKHVGDTFDWPSAPKAASSCPTCVEVKTAENGFTVEHYNPMGMGRKVHLAKDLDEATTHMKSLFKKKKK